MPRCSSIRRSNLPSLILCLLAVLPVAHSEIRPFNLLLEPSSEYVHYVEGFLISPGYIDLSKLKFATVDTGTFVVDDDEFNKGTDDVFDTSIQDDDSLSGGAGNDDAPRMRHKRQLQDEDVDDAVFVTEGSSLDIAVFQLPSECSGSRLGCDWMELGIGARTGDDSPRYCCSNEAIDLGLCSGTSYGRLIMDGEKFSGKHRLVNVPASGDFHHTLKYGKFEEKPGTSGKYVVLFANCNDGGRPVIVEGVTEWKSRHGYLPGDLFAMMYFFAFLFFVYFALLLWYGVTMKMYEDANIPIQGWIFGTIAMGCLEVFFRTGDLFVWNEEGYRFWAAFYIGVVVGVLKRGISRCLIVMVAYGWGVIRDDLGPVMTKINVLGGIYIAVSLVTDIMTVVAFTEVQKLSQAEEEELFDFVSILSVVVAAIDVIFYLWIIDSLNSTMEYLENMNQTSKLQRYLRLRSILLFSILFVIVWSVFEIVNNYDEGIVDESGQWVIDAAMELNYVFLLAAVAILWRPQPNAKEYAYVMELPAMRTDDDDEDGEVLEMTGVVPSAADYDDEEDEVVFSDAPAMT